MERRRSRSPATRRSTVRSVSPSPNRATPRSRSSSRTASQSSGRSSSAHSRSPSPFDEPWPESFYASSPLRSVRSREKGEATPTPSPRTSRTGTPSPAPRRLSPFRDFRSTFDDDNSFASAIANTSRRDASRRSGPSSPGGGPSDDEDGDRNGRGGRRDTGRGFGRRGGNRGRGGRGGRGGGGEPPTGPGPGGVDDEELARIRRWLAADQDECRRQVTERTREERAIGLLPYVRSDGLVEALAASRSKMVCDRVSPRLSPELAVRFRENENVNSVTGRPIRRGGFTWKVMRVAVNDRFPFA